jgi:predicted O-methyltransferase YrrM
VGQDTNTKAGTGAGAGQDTNDHSHASAGTPHEKASDWVPVSMAKLRQDHVADLYQAHKMMPGPNYSGALKWAHAALRPRTYLEIGVSSGNSLTFALPGTRCVGVDPEPKIDRALPEGTVIETMTSNAFFRDGAAERHFAESGIDLAFIDGLHLAEQVVQDFVYTLPYMNDGGVVVLHDVLPIRAGVAARDRTSLMWAGDVWKAALAIRACWPDLPCGMIACAPTGLMMFRAPAGTAREQRGSLKRQLKSLLPRTLDKAAREALDALPRIDNDEASVRAFVSGG